MLTGLQIIRRLSEGASAEVLLARRTDGASVLVEVLREELFCEPDLTQRFLTEARVRRTVEHPNVLRRAEQRESPDGRPCWVSEPVGLTLEALLRDRREGRGLSAEEALKLALPLCDALHALHLRGFVHNNVEPGAIWLPASGRLGAPKLFDAGLALFRPGRTFVRASQRVLVRREYLAPERLNGQRGTTRSDVYAVGVVLREVLLAADAARLEPILRRCLAADPRERFPSALALRDALAAQHHGTLPILHASRSESADGEAAAGVGEVVGRYELLEPLGEGAMGRVFRARHVHLGRLVALKLLKPEHACDRAQVERFAREARAVNRVRHPNIVEVFDLVDEEGPHGARRVYCVMELLRGHTLGETLDARPLPLKEALGLLAQVARALDAAHREGVVHRDVKPDNIFVCAAEDEAGGERFAKLVDFGVAKLSERPPREAGEPAESADSGERSAPGARGEALGLTATGALVGTPVYMSPEQALGGESDARSDVYGLGAVLFKVLTGGTPFVASSFEELSRQIALEPVPPLPASSPSGEEIPPALADLTLRCLEKDPARRPQRMAEVAVRLEALALAARHPFSGRSVRLAASSP